MDFLTLTVLLYVIGAIAVLLVLFFTLRNMWQVASPNEALIISGLGGGKDGRPFKIVTGSGTLVVPGLQTAKRLSLMLHEALLEVNCVTSQGIQVVIQGVCIYRVGDDDVSITNAARRFLGQESIMDKKIQQLLDGHLRSIVGTLTVEQLISDRVALTDKTRETAKGEVNSLGLNIESLQISDIQDPTKYIQNLAKPHIAEVEKAARIAQATANQQASIVEQDAAAKAASALSDSQIKQAEYQANTERAKALAAQQGPLAQAKAQQDVVVEETKLAELNASRTQQDLETTIRRPADAQAYQTQRIAEGQAQAVIAAANADAQRVKVAASADAEARTILGTADASAISSRGLAEAQVVKAKAIAEADGKKALGEALAANQDAVIQQTLTSFIPEIVRAAAEPFKNIDQMIVLNGAEGLSQMGNTIMASALTVLPVIVNKLKDMSKNK